MVQGGAGVGEEVTPYLETTEHHFARWLRDQISRRLPPPYRAQARRSADLLGEAQTSVPRSVCQQDRRCCNRHVAGWLGPYGASDFVQIHGIQTSGHGSDCSVSSPSHSRLFRSIVGGDAGTFWKMALI
jgi:hypothetical protein